MRIYSGSVWSLPDNYCTCTDKCTEGHVDPDCKVCNDNIENCKGLGNASLTDIPGESASQETSAKPELNIPMLAGGAAALIFLILLYFLKIRKKEGK